MANSEAMKTSAQRSDGSKGSGDTPDGVSFKMSQLTPIQDSTSHCDSQQASKSSFGFFSGSSGTFGSWLSKFTEGEKANISSKDLNAFAPTSF